MSVRNAAEQRGCRTLIVEDDEPAAQALAHLVRRSGQDVVGIAGSVGDALEALVRTPPECIILDLMLPDGNGVTVLRRARRLEPPVRVAIVTAVHDPFAIDQITDLQPDAVFEKPVDIEALLKWLKKPARAKTRSSVR